MGRLFFLDQGWFWGRMERECGRRAGGRPFYGWGCCRRGGSRLATGKAPFRFTLRAALSFRLLSAARFFLSLATFGCGAFLTFPGLALFAQFGFLFGPFALLDLAFTGVRKGARTCIPLFCREGTENDAG